MLKGPRENDDLNSIARTSEASALTSGVACNQTYLGNQRKNANNAMAAALMKSAQSHPSNCMPRELTRFPITRRSLVSSTTMMTRGGASRPFKIADQNSIFTASSLAKSNASPMSMAIAITA
jgi:hypothetical protein